jgi:hypothetical protein
MGVPEGLPEEVHVGRFLDARIKEISGKGIEVAGSRL